MPQVVRIAALPSVAQLWLSPRLPALRNAMPGTEISVTAMERAPNLHRELFDLSLFFDAKASGKGAVPLHEEEIFPVCAPELAAKLDDPRDLKDIPCLHDMTWSDDWDQWIAVASSDRPFKVSGPHFSLYSLAVDEALRGTGALMGHSPLLDNHIKSGALVAPFATRVKSGRWLVLAGSGAFAASSGYKPVTDVLQAR